MSDRLWRNPFFLGGLALKLIVMGLWGSEVLSSLFIPFLDQAVLNPGMNPWTLSPPEAFPYGSFLFLILYIPRLLAYSLFGGAVLGTTFWSLLLVRIPLLVFDVGLFGILLKMFPFASRSRLLIFYWLNPILFYITYVHGQLDVVSMCMCILSLYLATRDKVWLSALAMAAATLAKFHVVILLPFLFAYFWNVQFVRQAVLRIVQWLGLFTLVTGVGLLPVYLGQRLNYVTTTSPEAMRLFAAQLDFGGGQILYFGLLVMMLVIGRVCIASRITTRGLILGAGMIFGTLLFTTNPAPGWYYWFLPFLAIVFALYPRFPKILFAFLCAAYFIHFLELPLPPVLSQLTFTALQTTLFGVLVLTEFLVLRKEVPVLDRDRPFCVGMSGDSGAGKNYLCSVFQDLLGACNTLLVNGDDYHRWERHSENWKTMTHLDPKANRLDSLKSHVLTLAKGSSIHHAEYDHSTGLFTELKESRPVKNLVVQGLHALYPRALRHQYDLKVFLNPAPLLRLAWKVQRDVTERGHAPEKVLESIRKRAADSEQYVLTQKDYADLVIETLPVEELSEADALKGIVPPVKLRLTFWNDLQVNSLLETLVEKTGMRVTEHRGAHELEKIILDIQGCATAEQIEHVARVCFPNIRQIIRSRYPPTWRADYDGISQLILLAFLGARIHS